MQCSRTLHIRSQWYLKSAASCTMYQVMLKLENCPRNNANKGIQAEVLLNLIGYRA